MLLRMADILEITIVYIARAPAWRAIRRGITRRNRRSRPFGIIVPTHYGRQIVGLVRLARGEQGQPDDERQKKGLEAHGSARLAPPPIFVNGNRPVLPAFNSAKMVNYAR